MKHLYWLDDVAWGSNRAAFADRSAWRSPG
jgi:hypothetical protein